MFAAKPDGLALILGTHAVGGKHGFPPIPFAHTCSPHTLWPVERESASSRLPGKPGWTLTGSAAEGLLPWHVQCPRLHPPYKERERRERRKTAGTQVL